MPAGMTAAEQEVHDEAYYEKKLEELVAMVETAIQFPEQHRNHATRNVLVYDLETLDDARPSRGRRHLLKAPLED